MAENEMPEVPNVEDLKERLQELGDEVGLPGGGNKWLIMLAIIGGGFVALVLLIRQHAQTAQAASAAAAISPETINYTETLNQTETPGTPAPAPAPTPAPTPKPTPAPAPAPTPTPVINPVLPPRQVHPPSQPQPAPKPTPKPTPKPAPKKTYTVVAGDTLSNIAAKHGTNLKTLYAMNQRTIDAWAKAHGHQPPYYNWIFPGEILDLP